jgi:ABC-type dipeptide/oligopeptide/nickel transport system permease subunit
MLIFLAVLCTNLIGDGLNDVINPHLNDREKEKNHIFQ